MKKLLIIDGHAMIHRAYHALPPLRTKSGIPTNAIYGFFGMLYRAIEDMKPDYLLVAFDTPVPTFRKKLLDTYQSKRPELEESLVQQFELIKELLDAGNIARAEAPGFEADDVIGTLAVKYASKDLEVDILTGDKDILQLVNDHVKVIMPKIGLSQTITYDAKGVMEKMMVKPSQVADYKALCGDSSDNYIAVKGIGPKTAMKIFAQFDSLDDLYANIDKMTDEKLKQKLIDNTEAVKLLKVIATIKTDVPVDIKLEDMKVIPYPSTLRDTMEKYEFNSIKKRYFPEVVEDVEKAVKAAVTEKAPEKKKNPSQMDLF